MNGYAGSVEIIISRLNEAKEESRNRFGMSACGLTVTIYSSVTACECVCYCMYASKDRRTTHSNGVKTSKWMNVYTSVECWTIGMNMKYTLYLFVMEGWWLAMKLLCRQRVKYPS